MKVGDIVMYVGKGTYKEWFYGKIGEVRRSRINSAGEEYINVVWNRPVKYFAGHTDNSSFRASRFKLMKGAK